MKALVTGAAGFVGSHLVARLRGAGEDVLAVDLKEADGIDGCDVLDPCFPEIVAEYEPEVMFHLAGQIDVGESFADPLGDARTNVLGTLAAYEAAHAAGVRRFVFPSSWLVYDRWSDPPWDLSSKQDPTTPYGVSKHATELYLRTLSKVAGHPEVAVAVLGNVYGPYDTSVISLFAERLNRGEQITLNPLATRDFVHVTDVVSALLEGATRLSSTAEEPGFSRQHVASGVETSLEDVVARLAGLLEVDFARFVTTGTGWTDRACLSIDGGPWDWKPLVGLEEGLHLLVERLNR